MLLRLSNLEKLTLSQQPQVHFQSELASKYSSGYFAGGHPSSILKENTSTIQSMSYKSESPLELQVSLSIGSSSCDHCRNTSKYFSPHCLPCAAIYDALSTVLSHTLYAHRNHHCPTTKCDKTSLLHTQYSPQIKQYFGIPEAYVVYDQPPDIFGPPTLQERHELFKKLVQTTPDFRKAALAYTNALDAPTGELYNGNSAQALATLAPAAAAAADNSAAAVMATTRASLLAAAGSRVNSAIERLPDANGEERGTLGRENNDNSEQAHGQKRKKDHEPSSRFVEEKTLFTTRSATGEYALRRDRPALLVSSTSWTPDEDFSVLLDAVARLESRAASGAAPSLPFVVVVVTGKGPEKARYVERMRAMRLSRIALCTAWLDPEDYPVLLGSADLGISLHTSTSGELSFVFVC